MLFDNVFLSYTVVDSCCIITYKKGARIDYEVGRSIIEEKKRLQKVIKIKKFIGVIDSSVRIDKSIMKQFATKDALDGVDMIGVVFTSKNKLIRLGQRLGVQVLNGLIVFNKDAPPKTKFFCNQRAALNWMNK